MKSILFSFILFVCSHIGHSQNTDQNIISSTGETSSGSSITMSYTVGENVVETQSANNYTLTQGFHQSSFVIVNIEELIENTGLNVSIYPNPTVGNLFFTSENESLFPIQIKIFDELGKLVESAFVQKETEYSLHNLANGKYYINVFSKNDHIQNFTIIKNQ